MPSSEEAGKERTQHERFKETARALGCDEDEAAFNEKLKGIVRQKPKRDDAPPSGKP